MDGPWKLVQWHTPEARTELFRRDRDPGDREDLAAQHPVLAGYLATRLRAAQESGQLALRPGSGQVSPEQASQLRALGYVQ